METHSFNDLWTSRAIIWIYLGGCSFTTSAFNFNPSQILVAGGACLMLQVSFCGPKCLQLNCESLAEQQKSTRWMRWTPPRPPKKMYECPPEKGSILKGLHPNQPSILRGYVSFQGSILDGFTKHFRYLKWRNPEPYSRLFWGWVFPYP